MPHPTLITTRFSAIAIGLAVLLAGCAQPAPVNVVRNTDPAASPLEQAFVRSDVDFEADKARDVSDAGQAKKYAAATSRIGTSLVESMPGENVVASPLSLLLAFAMLREGATGGTAAQIDSYFDFDPVAPGEDIAVLRASLHETDGDPADLASGTPPFYPILNVADSLFAQPDRELGGDFLARIAQFHDAGLYEADFKAGTAQPILDAWVDRESGGLITTAPSVDDDTLLALLSTVAFGAAWEYLFGEVESDSPFRLADGSTVPVEMMITSLEAHRATGPGWEAMALPTERGKFSVYVALPTEGAPPLTAKQWDEVRTALAAATEPVPSFVRLPMFSFNTTLKLGEFLPTQGLTLPFSPTGDLDGIFPEAYVQQVDQKAMVTVGTEGVIAAAVTLVGMAAGGGGTPEPFIVDRPFGFQIVRDADQLTVFSGHVANPSLG